ncbi:PREDICTED: mediator of RNA polymerase II transcription subunit 26-like [Rhagoletis zephyria]|uniref:mediator of RNA polymerase II transcription subunit 26-like n=1 Tax=Rhagoletis zephyria TaxID=28612 RepID=UPI000811329F|nr:PREDICTED: mediator of RNA polymerase II transcription subunit 26-like [Rhagoletis zephyria]
MNTKYIHDLTFRLCQALDRNYDVVNMDTVMSVISTLEGTTITKEQLEATRLAKFINLLRRRTKDEHLARRAKSLVKKWREMVGIQQQQQHVTETTAIPSSAALQPSIYQQQRMRSQSISPAASSLHFDTIQQHSNSNSCQAVAVIAATSTSENTPRLTSVTSVPLSSISARSANANVHNSNKRLEGQNEFVESGLNIHVRKPPTSFENVLSSFGDAQDSNIGITCDNSTFRHKVIKPVKQRVTPLDHTETFIIDQSSNSNSESLILPTNSRPSNIAPIVIDIQDSNSGSNLVTSILMNPAVGCKIASSKPNKAQSANLDSKPNITTSAFPSLKSKKLKKEKKRRDRVDVNAQGGIDNIDGVKMSAVLDENSSNPQRRQQSGDNAEQFTSFVKEDKSRLAYPEILSLLDNSSVSSMFPPEGSTNPVDDTNKVKSWTSNSSHAPLNLSTSDLTFTGKFKQGNTLPSTTSGNELIGFNAHRRTVSPKQVPTNSFSLQTGHSATKFMPFREVGSNSNDSNSNSQASQMDLIDIVSNDKMVHAFQAQRKQDSSNPQQKTVGAANISTSQAVPAPAFFPQKIPPSNTMEATIVAASNTLVSSDKKLPRKRGRKKGSKGVDSVIAKETSLTSQMLMTSLGSGNKKVKTTKELYAEMQNRKLGIAVTSSSPTSSGWPVPQQQTSRPTSSCSEPSLQSPHTFDACSTNATMSTGTTRFTPDNFLNNTHADEGETTSDTVTSEPSRDSSALPQHLKRSLSIDSNSNSQFLSSVKITAIPRSTTEMQSSDTANKIAAVEKQLLEIFKKLPPVPNITAIELKFTEESIPCTCKITEISPENRAQKESIKTQEAEIEAIKVVPEQNNRQSASQERTFVKTVVRSEATGGITIIPGESELKQMPQETSPSPSTRPKPKKSIFDLDFDDDDDPLNTLKAEAAAAILEKENVDETLKVEEQAEPQVSTTVVNQFESQLLDYKMSIEQAMIEEAPMRIFPTYEVEEDPLCMAKQRFDIQTQKITKFHIDALHNCFIPNVNGNWDNANSTIGSKVTLDEVIAAVDAETGYVISDGCNVVPKYGSLVKERIRKDLSHISFSKNYKSKKVTATMEQMYVVPFLGVARSILVSKKRKSHNHRTCRKIKVTALNNCLNQNINDAESQFQENKKTEEYKTDEDRIGISEIKKDTESDSTPKETTSKKLIDIYKHSLNPDVKLGVIKPFDLATSTIVGKNNNNNVTLKDITIDVIGHSTDMFHLNADVHNCQNLLAIADHLDYSSKSAHNATAEMDIGIQEQSDDQQKYRSESSSVRDLISGTTTGKDIFPNMLQLPVTKESAEYTHMNENKSSRRSSSCSNSSLKQTQQSINLKLRRKFQEQKLLDVNGDRKRRRKKLKRRCTTDDNAGKESKHPKLKRIKIAINGDVATQMQISGGSSNNCTDEDSEDQHTDTCSLNENDDGDGEITADDENERAIRASAANEDVESINSAGSSILTYNRFNLTNADDELDANSAENHCTAEQEIGYEEYGDLDVDADVEFDEYEDAEDYSGDFHEVVTRDISAPSTGNNHIVLTIKKTPSKTNSPSNSLSAISPVVVSNNENGSQTSGVTTVPIVSKGSVHTAHSIGEIENNALIVKKLDLDEDKSLESLVPISEVSNILISGVKENQTQLLSHTQTDADIISDIQDAERNSPKRSESLASTSSLELAPFIAKYVYNECRKKRRRRKIKRAESVAKDCLRDIKLHHELFFPFELIISDNDGIKHNILNISSCSSSCVEDSDYDDRDGSVPIATSCKTRDKTYPSRHSQIGIKLETSIESCERNSDISGLQQRDRTLTSSCSTYSSSTCDSLIKYRVKLDCCNDSGDIPTEAAEVRRVENASAENQSEKNYINAESSPVENTPYSNEVNSTTLADTTDKNIEDNVNEDLPLENNGLLHSFNNIYYTVDKFEDENTNGAINNGNIIGSTDSLLIGDNVVLGPAAVNAANQQERELPNKNCDDYNNIYNKNSNNINLIRYNNNEPSLVTHVYRNKKSGSSIEDDQQQKGNCLTSGDDYNANIDDYVCKNYGEELIVNNDDKKTVFNSGSNQIEPKAGDKEDLSFNSSGENYEIAHAGLSSMQTRCSQVMLPHKEFRTGLRAVDEDVDDEDGNNCGRIQQFKEWHQVLQLRSYNDDLLTVLPYVVLD